MPPSRLKDQRTLPGVGSRNILPDMFGQDLVDQRLVSDLPALRLFTEAVQDVWIHPDRDQPTCSLPKRGPADSTHRPELFVRRFWNIRKVNSSTRTGTLSFPSCSRALR